MAQNSFKVGKSLSLANQASAPSSPTNGDVYYDSTLGQFQFRQAGAWAGLGSGGGGGVNAVSNTYGPTPSTAGQTTISLGFAVTTTSCFFLIVDGKLLSLGASADYTFTNSTTIALNQALPAGLNIQAFYFGTVASGTVVTTASPLDKNYLTYSNFENNATTGFSLFNTTLTGVLPTGTISAGATSLALSATSSSPIAGTYSLQVAAGTAATAGQGVITDAYTIDSEYQAKVMGFSFAYKAVSGTMNFSGSSSNSFAVYIYDVTNSQWIQPAGVYNLVQSSGVGICSGTFQTSANGTQYRVAVLCINTTSGAVTLMLDDFFLGPPLRNAGPAMTDWQQYTMTIGATTTPPTKGTVAIDAARWRRVGDSMEIEYTYKQTAAGSDGSGTYLFPLPSGYSVDSSKTTIDTQFGSTLGWGQATNATDNQSTTTMMILAAPYNSTNLQLLGQGTYGLMGPIGGGNFRLGASGTISYHFKALVPITGWSSNSVMSSDTDTRVVACIVHPPSGSTSANQPIIWSVVEKDTHGAYSTSTGKYTAPVSGYYFVTTCINTNSGGASTEINAYVNGTAKALMGFVTAQAEGNGNTVVYLNAGDTVDVRLNVSCSMTAGNSAGMEIFRLSGPAVITAADTVACEYNSVVSSTVNVTTTYYVDFGTKESDSHNAVLGAGGGNVTTQGAGWRFVAPISGRYHVDATYGATVTGGAGSSTVNLKILVNGVTKQYGARRQLSHVNGPQAAGVSGTVKLNAGDIIEIAYSQDAQNGISTLNGAGEARACIYRVGN